MRESESKTARRIVDELMGLPVGLFIDQNTRPGIRIDQRDLGMPSLKVPCFYKVQFWEHFFV